LCVYGHIARRHAYLVQTNQLKKMRNSNWWLDKGKMIFFYWQGAEKADAVILVSTNPTSAL
jgi:hypothetical protein